MTNGIRNTAAPFARIAFMALSVLTASVTLTALPLGEIARADSGHGGDSSHGGDDHGGNSGSGHGGSGGHGADDGAGHDANDDKGGLRIAPTLK